MSVTTPERSRTLEECCNRYRASDPSLPIPIVSLGLPGLAGFWGEMLALLGAYRPAIGLSPTLFRILMVGAGIGTVLTAGYFLWMLQRVNLGRIPEKFAGGGEDLRRPAPRMAGVDAVAPADRRRRPLSEIDPERDE